MDLNGDMQDFLNTMPRKRNQGDRGSKPRIGAGKRLTDQEKYYLRQQREAERQENQYYY